MALSKVRLGRQLPPLETRGKLLNGEETFLWIYKRRDLVGWTYSVRRPLALRFKQLIAYVGEPAPNIKFAQNVHMKCYIDKKSMLIGSFNLTAPTIEDLCVEITDQSLVAFMRIQFRKHWKAL